MLRILIADQQPLLCFALATLLRQTASCECWQAHQAREARQRFVQLKPDIALIELDLPLGDSLDLVREFLEHHPPVRLIILSSGEDMTLVHRALQAGVHAFLSKIDDLPDFAQVLQHLRDGRRFLSARLIAQSLIGIGDQDKCARDEKVKRLSNRELFVFRLIGRQLGVSAIAAELGLSVKTIETHQSRIKEKLKITSCATLRACAIEWVEGAVKTAALLADKNGSSARETSLIR
jgi:DNA-binding NarL/FixJ family response regulator